MQKNQFIRLRKLGVTILNYRTTHIDDSVVIEPCVVIHSNNNIYGKTYIHKNCTLFPNNIISNCEIGNDTEITASVIKDSQIGERCQVGPNSYLRPHSCIGNSCRIGDFVEIKNATIGDFSKVSHLAYVGDASVGKSCNIGCGVIFVNYNGKIKQHTKVGDGSFIGSNCNLIAPLTIGEKVYICAGTTVTENISDESFVIGRAIAVEKKNRSEKYLK